MATREQMRQLGLASRKYVWGAELDALLIRTYTEARSVSDLSRALDRLERLRPWPRYAWRGRAKQLGLTRGNPRPWSKEDDRVLMDWAGSHSSKRLAKSLGRSVQAVQHRAQRLETSLARRDGFTVEDLARCFGVSRWKAARWVAKGWLGAGARQRVGEDHVRRFIREHPTEFDLRRVDQVWFLSMVVGKT